MPASPECPAVECWQALFDEAVSPERRAEYERHLETCPACQARLDRVAEEGGAGILNHLRRSGGPDATPPDPALSRVLERLHEGKPLSGAGPSEPADLYFLRPSEQPGVLGTLGDYEVLEVVGQGGMGVVLKALDPALNRYVAIKVMAAAVAGSATARRRFTREAQAAAAVCHDHVVAVHGVHEVEGLPYLVMQYVAGETLQERLDRTGPLGVEEAVRIGMQAASGLAAAHAQGLIHRDIKPANLLLENGVARVKITDFGLARMVDDARLTQAGVVAGTPEYMAPEQARGEAVDHRADLFSLGGVLYACCTGEPPFRGGSAVAVLRQVSDGAPPPIRARNTDVPAWLETLIARLMAKAPAERFQSAAEVAALLEGYLAHLRQPATVPAPPLLPAPGSPPPARPRAFGRLTPTVGLVAVALLAAGLVGAGTLLLLAQRPGGAPPGGPIEFRQDFRAADFDPEALEPFGPGVTRDGSGLRLTLEAGPDLAPNTGLNTTFPVRGDFEITTSYEVGRADRPEKGYGVGVGLYAPIDPGTQDAASLARRLFPDGTARFVSNRMTPAAGGKVNFQVKEMPSTSPAGNLRLERVGSVLTFLVADGPDAPFVVLDRVDFGTADLQFVRVEGSRGGSDAGLDARVLDFSVRAGGLPGAGPASPERLAGHHWLAAAAVVGLLIVLALLGGWLLSRRALHESGKTLPAPAGLVRRSPRLLLPAVLLLLAGGGLVGLYFLGVGGQAAGADGASPPVRRLQGHTGPVHNLRFAPDGRLFSGSGWPKGDATLRVWDVATGQQRSLFNMPGQVQAFDLTPDGRFALLGLGNGWVVDFDTEAAKSVQVMRGHRGSVGWVAFSPDGTQAFSGGADGTARMWDLKTGQEVKRFAVANGRDRGGAVLPDGKQLLTGDAAGILQFWDVATGREIKRIGLPPPAFIDSLSLTSDGRQALVTGVGGARLINLETGEEVRRFQEENEEVHQAVLSPDGRWLLTAGLLDGVVRLWDFQTWDLVRELGRHEGFLFTVAFSPDGRFAVSGGGGSSGPDGESAGTDHDIRLWELTADAAPPRRAGGRVWLAAAGGLFLVAGLALLGTIWFVRRCAEKAPAPAPAGAGKSPLIAVRCPGCGKNLRARGSLAGKSVKCPHCGGALAVPGIKAAETGGTP